MALQAWFQFNGNINNYGLSQFATLVPYGGVSVNDSGKIGKCYTFNGSDGYFDVEGVELRYLTNFSFSAWVCPRTNSLSNVMQCRRVVGSTRTVQLRIMGNSFEYRDSGTSGIGAISFSNNFTAYTWVHITVVYDNGSIFLYENGSLVNSYISPEPRILNNITEFRIGRIETTTTDYYYSGKINDVRVYDHSLSPKEVKEISKALIVHYPMTENCQVMDNLISCYDFNCVNLEEYWSVIDGTGRQNSNKSYIWNKNKRFSYHLNNNGVVDSVICQDFAAIIGSLYSIQAIIKLGDSSFPTTTQIDFYVLDFFGLQETTFTSLGNGFYLMKKEGFVFTSAKKNSVGIRIRYVDVYISEIYLEQDRVVCSDILFRHDVMCDCSGYLNNATTIESYSLRYDNDNHRYNLCASNLYNRVENPFFIGSVNIPSSKDITICWWAKYDNPRRDYPAMIMLTDDITSLNYGALYYENKSLGTSSHLNFVGNSGTKANVPYTLQEHWSHYLIKCDGREATFYVNGVLYGYDRFNDELKSFNYIYMSYYTDNNEIICAQGFLSDFRVYATALSDEDIMDLYNTSSVIDNTGNVMPYQLIESDEPVNICKTGSFISSAFTEVDTGVCSIYSGNVESNQFIEI